MNVRIPYQAKEKKIQVFITKKKVSKIEYTDQSALLVTFVAAFFSFQMQFYN